MNSIRIVKSSSKYQGDNSSVYNFNNVYYLPRHLNIELVTTSQIICVLQARKHRAALNKFTSLSMHSEILNFDQEAFKPYQALLISF